MVLYTFQIVVGSRVTSISTPFVLSVVETKMDRLNYATYPATLFATYLNCRHQNPRGGLLVLGPLLWQQIDSVLLLWRESMPSMKRPPIVLPGGWLASLISAVFNSLFVMSCFGLVCYFPKWCTLALFFGNIFATSRLFCFLSL